MADLKEVLNKGWEVSDRDFIKLVMLWLEKVLKANTGQITEAIDKKNIDLSIIEYSTTRLAAALAHEKDYSASAAKSVEWASKKIIEAINNMSARQAPPPKKFKMTVVERDFNDFIKSIEIEVV